MILLVMLIFVVETGNNFGSVNVPPLIPYKQKLPLLKMNEYDLTGHIDALQKQMAQAEKTIQSEKIAVNQKNQSGAKKIQKNETKVVKPVELPVTAKFFDDIVARIAKRLNSTKEPIKIVSIPVEQHLQSDDLQTNVYVAKGSPQYKHFFDIRKNSIKKNQQQLDAKKDNKKDRKSKEKEIKLNKNKIFKNDIKDEQKYEIISEDRPTIANNKIKIIHQLKSIIPQLETLVLGPKNKQNITDKMNKTTIIPNPKQEVKSSKLPDVKQQASKYKKEQWNKQKWTNQQQSKRWVIVMVGSLLAIFIFFTYRRFREDWKHSNGAIIMHEEDRNQLIEKA